MEDRWKIFCRGDFNSDKDLRQMIKESRVAYNYCVARGPEFGLATRRIAQDLVRMEHDLVMRKMFKEKK